LNEKLLLFIHHNINSHGSVLFCYSEKDFSYICEEQPIGQRLFQEFCQTKDEFAVCRECLKQMVSWD